ncbi:MAG: hypothetical protein V3U34_00740 [candidate division NC10 bacterium]
MPTKGKGSLTARPTDLKFEAAAGYYDLDALTVVGENPDINGTTEDIWDAGGIWVPPTVARIHDIVSTSTDDAAAGSGLRTVLVRGLDTDLLEQQEVVTLDGTDDVATTNSYRFISELRGLTVGAGGVNVGTVTATAQTDATVSVQMAIGRNLSCLGIHIVPSNKEAYLTRLLFGFNSTIGALTSTIDGVLATQVPFQGTDVAIVSSAPGRLTRNVLPVQETHFDPYVKFPPISLIKMQGTNASSTNNNMIGVMQFVQDRIV